ncbi:hypothetical protein, partial [Mariniradius sediminis]
HLWFKNDGPQISQMNTDKRVIPRLYVRIHESFVYKELNQIPQAEDSHLWKSASSVVKNNGPQISQMITNNSVIPRLYPRIAVSSVVKNKISLQNTHVLEGNSATYPQMAKLHLSQISYFTSQI